MKRETISVYSMELFEEASLDLVYYALSFIHAIMKGNEQMKSTDENHSSFTPILHAHVQASSSHEQVLRR